MSVVRYARSLALFLVFALSASAGIWFLGSKPPPEARASLLRADDPATVHRGKRVYEQSCADCHGVRLQGQAPDWRSPGPDGRMPAPPHDETGHTWHHSDAMLFAITKHGVAEAAQISNYDSAMPIYAGLLSDDDIIAVLSFIKSTWPRPIRDRHDELNQRVEEQQDG